MKSTTIVAFLAGIAAVSAVPAPVDATVSAFAYPEGVTATVYADGLPASLVPRAIGLQKRSDASVYFCTDVGFNGYCVDINVNYYQCVNLGPDLNDKVSAVGPDGNAYCLFYGNYNCQDNEGHFGTYRPGYSDLRSINFNDKISSFICYPQ